jgi:alpha-ribazole phosphatase
MSEPVAGTTRVHLLRHAEVHPEDANCLYGQADVRLSDHGARQSEEAGLWFATRKVAAVYSSDLFRARYLAEQIAQHHHLAVQTTPLLRERFFGSWQGLSWAEIETDYPAEFAEYQSSRFIMRVPGGAENFHDVGARVSEFLAGILDRHRGESIVITCHSGPARLLLTMAMNMPIESVFHFDQDYCCRNLIDYREDGSARVRLLNGLDHLGPFAPVCPDGNKRSLTA